LSRRPSKRIARKIVCRKMLSELLPNRMVRSGTRTDKERLRWPKAERNWAVSLSISTERDGTGRISSLSAGMRLATLKAAQNPSAGETDPEQHPEQHNGRQQRDNRDMLGAP